MILLVAHEARRTTERGMRETARALALALDHEVGEVRAALGVLAVSRPLAAGDLADFYQQCLEALHVLPPETWLTLSDRHGQLLLDTRVSYDALLPMPTALAGARAVVATGRPSQSDLVVDPVTHQMVVTLDVPVRRGGEVEAVLSLTRPAAAFGRLFGEQQLPPGWIAGLNDRQYRILARSHAPERFIGAPATPRMAERSAAAEEGWFPNRSQEGTLIYTAFSRVQSTGWTMALLAPAAVVDAPGRRFLWILVSGALALSAVAVGWALRLGWQLAMPIQALVPATQALAQGLPVPRAPVGAVQEVQDVAAALHAAATLLQQREAALDEQRERLHTTLASIGDAVIATDHQGRVTFLNPVATALTGWADTEALGQPITVVFPIVNEATRQIVENPVTRVLREGAVVGLANHTVLLGRDGEARPIDDSGAPIRDAQGQLVGVVLVFRDITARRQAEAARMLLAAIVESSEDAILSKTLDGIITSWNRGAERLYGYPAAEMVGQSLTRLIPPDLPDDLPQILARLRQGDAIEHYETQRVARDGARLEVTLTISPLRDGAGQLIGASTIARDITARKQAEAELERRRQETALLADIAQRLSASLDLDTVLQRIVAGVQALCGSERALIALRDPGTDILVGRYEIGAPQRAYAGLRIAPGQGLGGQVLRTGRPWRTADYATDPRFSKEFLAGARAAGHLAVLAVPILIVGRVEGLLYASNPASQPFTAPDEALLVRLATHAALALQNARLYQQAQTELAHRQTAEAALARAAAELEQRVEERTAALHQEMAERQRLEREAQRVQHFALLGQLAAGVSHEIRNPLGAIFLHVDVLTEELAQPSPDNPAVVAEALAEIKTQLARLDDLVQDYLTLVRVHTIQREVQDLGRALAAWSHEFQGVVAAHGGQFHVEGVEPLGLVAFHASTLRRALLNLVQNAAEALAPGGTVTLAGLGTPVQVQLQVRDTGSGIPATQLSQMCEPLHTTKPGGTGLGLYIVQQIVAAHEGQVTVDSQVGQGTTLTITLPRS
jgi:PAS domain S-box-containing protein